MSKPSKAFDRLTLRYFWKASLRQRRYLLLSLLVPLGTLAINIVLPFFIGKVFAALIMNPDRASQYLLPIIVISLSGVLANRFGIHYLMVCQARTMSYLQSHVLSVLLKRSVGFHNNRISGKLVSDAIDYPNAYGGLIVSLFVNILPFALILVVGVILVLVHSLIMGAALAVIVVVTIVWALIESRKRSGLRMIRLGARKAVTAHLSDTIINAQTVKTFAREDDELGRHSKLNNTLEELNIRDWTRAGRNGNDRMAVLLLMQVAFIALTIRLVQNDPGLLAIGIFAFTFTLTLVGRLFELNTLTRTVEDAFLQASPMTEIISQSAEIADEPNATSLAVKEGGITFDHISFHYPDSDSRQAVFKDLDLRIAPGEKIGLVGPSGGGKSTLTRLLLRFEDIQEGRIILDGQDISSVTQDSLHHAISYVPQEPLLFHRSVRDNIAYGNPSATTQQIADAAHKAYALDFIQVLPHGFETIVGERGVKLSGGQRQRIAIARAILKDAPILLLDEATSALDSESEQMIQKALDELMHGKTTIVIAHRLSTIQKMDRILVLEGGRIVEQGAHKELVGREGLYATLWRHQSGGFIED